MTAQWASAPVVRAAAFGTTDPMRLIANFSRVVCFAAHAKLAGCQILPLVHLQFAVYKCE